MMIDESTKFTTAAETTPEGAALVLLQLVARSEGMSFEKGKASVADRDWILKAYRECLSAARSR